MTKVSPAAEEPAKKEQDILKSIPLHFINPNKQNDYLGVYVFPTKGKAGRCTWGNKIPFLNTLLDDFYYKSFVTNERIRHLFEHIALLTGLLFSAVAQIPMSVSYDEVELVRLRFDAYPYNGTRWAGTDSLVKEVVTYSTASLYFLGTATNLIVFFFFISGYETYNTPDVPCVIRAHWWKLNKFIVLMVTFSAIVGIMFSFLAVRMFAVVKFPDLHVEGYCNATGKWNRTLPCEGGGQIKVPSTNESTYGAFYTWLVFMFTSLALVWGTMSWTRCRRGGVIRKTREVYKKAISGWEKKRQEVLRHLATLTLQWDVYDALKPQENPYLLDLQDVSSFCRKTDVEDGNESLDMKPYMILDPRVRNAFGVLQKLNFVDWTRFLEQFHKSLKTGVSFQHQFGAFCPRMLISLIELEDTKENIYDETKFKNTCKEIWDRESRSSEFRDLQTSEHSLKREISYRKKPTLKKKQSYKNKWIGMFTVHNEFLDVPVRFINPTKQNDFTHVRSMQSLVAHEWIYKIPLINSFFDEFLDDEFVSNTRLYQLLEPVGLITGLFLSAIISIPMSVNFGELRNARDRFDIPPYSHSRWGADSGLQDKIIRELTMYTTGAIYILGSVMCTIVLFYFFSNMENINSADTPGIVRKSWWKYNRFIVFWTVLGSMGGICFSFFAINRFAFIKFPDIWIETACKMPNATGTVGNYIPRWDRVSTCTGGRDAKFPTGFDSAYGSYLTLGYCYMLLCLIVAWIIMSYTRAAQGGVEQRVFEQYKVTLGTWNKKRSEILKNIVYIVKCWDEEDGLFDNVNPYHIDLFNTKALTGVTKKNKNEEDKARLWLDHASLDPRVLQAVGTIHKHGYNSWENFIYEFDKYKDDPKVLFTDFSVRMELSLRKYIREVSAENPTETQEKNLKKIRIAKLKEWNKDYKEFDLDSKLKTLMDALANKG